MLDHAMPSPPKKPTDPKNIGYQAVVSEFI